MAVRRAIAGLLSGIAEKARRGLVRAPMEVAIGVAAAVVLTYGWGDPVGDPGEFAARFVVAAIPTLIAVFATSALYELGVIGFRERWLVTAFYLVAGLVYGGFVLDFDQQAEMWRWGLLTAGLGLATVLTPLAASSSTLDSRELTWRFTLRLCIRLAVVGAYTTILYIGLSLGILAFGEMFEVDIAGEVYPILASWVFAAGGTWMVAAGLLDMTDRESPIAPRVIGLIHKIGVWLVLPLLGLYMLILYGYGARVLLTGEAPSNLLSPLALGAAMLGLIAMFFVEPLRRHGDDKWLAEVFEKFPLAYLPLLPMPAWAIWQRIAQHGWTEFRYVRLLAVGGLVVCFGYGAWRVVRSRSYSVTAMPACFAVLFFLASFGPWGALGVSESSQVRQLKMELEKGESSGDELVDDDPALRRNSTYRGRGMSQSDAVDRLRYLYHHYGVESLEPVLPEEAGSVDTFGEACEVLELDCGYTPSGTRLKFDAPGPIQVPAEGRLYSVTYYSSGASADGSLSASVEGTTATFEFRSEERFSIDLAEQFAVSLEEEDQRYVDQTLMPEEATVRLSSEGEGEAYFHLENLTLRREDADSEWRVVRFGAKLLKTDS